MERGKDEGWIILSEEETMLLIEVLESKGLLTMGAHFREFITLELPPELGIVLKGQLRRFVEITDRDDVMKLLSLFEEYVPEEWEF